MNFRSTRPARGLRARSARFQNDTPDMRFELSFEIYFVFLKYLELFYFELAGRPARPAAVPCFAGRPTCAATGVACGAAVLRRWPPQLSTAMHS
jgi:hypothetical protein